MTPKKRAKPAKKPARVATGEAAQANKAALAARFPGFSPVMVQKLLKLGLTRSHDLALHLPLRYEDETRLTPISEVLDGVPVQIEGNVVDCTVAYRPRRQLVVKIADASGEMWLRFMNFYPSQQKVLAPGARVRVFGEARAGFFGGEMIHPRFTVVRAGAALSDALTPVYPTTAGLGQYTLRKLIVHELERSDLSDTLPEEVTAPLDLPSFVAALALLHHPQPGMAPEGLSARNHRAWRRMKFDELLAQQLSMRLHYRERRARNAPRLAQPGALTGGLQRGLPFKLTAAQLRCWGEIEHDLAEPHPMNRLLQGDVGSGKTVVAALAVLRAVESGWQAAVMAPTEILAEQNFRKFSEWLAPLGVAVTWLTGSLKKRERDAATAAIANGAAAVAVGTHALFQDQVEFDRLGLAIIDEQHRFGVGQRLALRQKGRSSMKGLWPHQLMMSATPIPRTLSMSYYADLDVSVVDELPPGRRPVITKLIGEARRDEVLARVREACEGGRQVYWVCPLIEESETLQLQTAIDTHFKLTADLPGLHVGLVHGRLPPAEKAAVMRAFVAGEVNLLVATTVIEVGVDVPNASLMVIEHAERFGLSQLHQLRGRVGRGAHDSACILLYQNPLSEGARARLKIIFESSDGFVIAQRDLELRGPGEMLGLRQSGAPLLRFADLETDGDLLAAAREAADRLLQNHPQQAARHLERWLGGRHDYLKA
ncbi:MAG: ATP-dependent DNA helicase RecG [Betaproteobacteria bacterium]